MITLNNRNLRGSLLLLLGAMIWGFAFVAQRVGMDSMQPVSFNGIRNLLAGCCLIPAAALAGRRASSGGGAASAPPVPRALQRKAGLLCGVLLFLASTLQQMGLVDTAAGKAGFITALYVVLVPVVGWILFRKNPGPWVWLSILLAVAGLFLLCVPAGERFSLARGDLLLLGCAVCFTGQILCVDRYGSRVDPLRLSRDEFLVCGGLGVAVSLLTETVTLSSLREALPALLYAGVISGAVGYTLQIFGQRDTDPAVASLIMCMESVFSVLSGALVLGERMSLREGAGCVIMFAAVVLAQVSPLLHQKRRAR